MVQALVKNLADSCTSPILVAIDYSRIASGDCYAWEFCGEQKEMRSVGISWVTQSKDRTQRLNYNLCWIDDVGSSHVENATKQIVTAVISKVCGQGSSSQAPDPAKQPYQKLLVPADGFCGWHALIACKAENCFDIDKFKKINRKPSGYASHLKMVKNEEEAAHELHLEVCETALQVCDEVWHGAVYVGLHDGKALDAVYGSGEPCVHLMFAFDKAVSPQHSAKSKEILQVMGIDFVKSIPDQIESTEAETSIEQTSLDEFCRFSPFKNQVKHLEHDQPGTPPAEEVDDERLGTPAQAPEQPAQQAASPGNEQGASEVKHLEHDQNGTPPAEEVDDERRGTPAQAPEQPAQQALPAKEQILSTSPQASAPMADQHQDMPGASERKHLEHDQPCIPPHTSKQSARPAEQVVDEHLSAARGKGKGQGNKRQFAANGSTDIVGPEFKKNKTAFLVPNEQCRACDSNQEESMDSKNEESSEQPKSSSHEDLSHTTSRQSSNDSLQLPEASGSQPQRSSSGEDDETMVKCMMLTNDHWEQWLHSGGKWLLRTYAISKLPHTLHIIVSVKGGQQFLYVGSIVIVDCLEVVYNNQIQTYAMNVDEKKLWYSKRKQHPDCKIYVLQNLAPTVMFYENVKTALKWAPDGFKGKQRAFLPQVFQQVVESMTMERIELGEEVSMVYVKNLILYLADVWNDSIASIRSLLETKGLDFLKERDQELANMSPKEVEQACKKMLDQATEIMRPIHLTETDGAVLCRMEELQFNVQGYCSLQEIAEWLFDGLFG
ncbi:unnamed protein product [Durusdinium trenchii]|uniref:OTU domain-containing protein n=1 Tax=Durusdinium trenchii TaxID=1381693 RepID=A0ABP0QCF9_9DINO